MSVDQNQQNLTGNPLELNQEQIKCMKLSILIKVLPVCENKYSEVTKLSELLQKEIKKQKQKLNGSEVEKFEQETSISMFKKIDKELSVRESKALHDLAKVTVLRPIYNYKNNCFLKQFHSEDKLTEYRPSLHGNQNLNELLQKKKKLQNTIDENKKILEDFVENYLT